MRLRQSFLSRAAAAAGWLVVCLLAVGCAPPTSVYPAAPPPFARATATARAAELAPEQAVITATVGSQLAPAAPGSLADTSLPADGVCQSQELALLPSAHSDLDLLDDPTCYQLDLSIDTDEAWVWGHADVHYTNNEDVSLSEVYFRLFRNLASAGGGAMEITRLAVSGVELQPSLEWERTALKVPLSEPLDPDESVDVSLDFRVSLPPGAGGNYGAFSAQQGVLALAHIYPFVPVYDDEGWNIELAPPFGDLTFADMSLYDVSVTVPEEMVVVATGVALPAVAHDYGRATWRFVSGPVRDVDIVLSRRYQRMQQEVEGITINAYYLPEDREGAAAVLDVAAEAMRIYSGLLGSYPYTELDVVPTFTSAGGIEYPGLIVISQPLYQANLRAEWVVAHEVAHQWWYNLVGNDQVDEPWLDEALTQYTTTLYYENRYGTKAAEQVRQSNLLGRWDTVVKEGHDRPVVGSVASFAASEYSPIVYAKGALFFQELRELVGDDVFYDFLRTYLEEHRYRIATGESLLAVAEGVSGRDLDELYRQWILQ